MDKRKLYISVAGIAILIIGVMLSRLLSSTGSEDIEKEKAETVNRFVVRTKEVHQETIKSKIEITGRLIASEQVDLFAEVSGVSTYGVRPFKTGNTFSKGEVMLKIDKGEFIRSLASIKSQFSSLLAQVLPDLKLDYPDDYAAWKDYLLNYDIDKNIAALPEVKNEQLKFFLTGRSIYSNYYSILESEERLSKYVIRAPFTGSLTETFIDQGTLVRTGQQLGEFIKNGTFEIEASIAYDQLSYLEKGKKVQFTDVKGSDTHEGTLIRINNKIDPTTQLVKVYFQLNDQRLRSGLYLNGHIESTTFEHATILPIESLVDQTFVLVAQNGKAIKKKIEVHNQNVNDFIAVGLKDGEKVIIDKKNSAFEGTEVIEM
ncbi:efflux RND transporter periplasmic adaptor subunit [Chondrinema litorale]|uniref:efflux RND transporter periplasmic adaptor subunit n=1 Tax=Chondrinema litorale TaxID=2994555 RepID=UPI0025431633|nr:efflux RND transporter periplasmic adaptor subunit [Chondrinema litorale]UZR99943.1 efflux RND transporter periplasmic adaptor subunit [Chondrinema litorale]